MTYGRYAEDVIEMLSRIEERLLEISDLEALQIVIEESGNISKEKRLPSTESA